MEEDQPRKKKIGVIAAVVILLALIMIFRSLSSKKEENADPLVLCKSHLSRIANAWSDYSKAHEGQLPESLAELVAGNYISVEDFICPFADRAPGHPDKVDEWSDYRLAASSAKGEASQRILAYCSPKIHDGRAVVVFADGKTDIVSESKLKQRLTEQAGSH